MTKETTPAPRSIQFATIWGVFSLAMPIVGSLLLIRYIHPVGGVLKDDAGPVVFGALFALSSGLALLPTYIQSGLSGFVFGASIGSAAALGGFLGGAVIGFVVCRAIAGTSIMERVSSTPRALLVRNALVGENRPYWRTVGIVSLLRLPPNSPFAITNLAMAGVGVPFSAYLIGTLIGMTPRTVLAVFIGAGLTDLSGTSDLNNAMPRWVKYAGIAVSVAVLLLIGYLAKSALQKAAAQGPGVAADRDLERAG